MPLPPPLSSLAAEWQAYAPGLALPMHGLALPTANSLRGSVIADENLLAVRSLTLPPFTQGPYSGTARNISRLGRLSIDGSPVVTQATRWTPSGFLRKASGTWGAAQSSAWLPLDEDAMLLELVLTAGEPAVGDGESLLVDVALLPEIRKWPRPACSDRERRFPSGMATGCWNWFAPRTTEAERADFSLSAVHPYHSPLPSAAVPFAVDEAEALGVYVARDGRSSARAALALLGSHRATVVGGGGGEGEGEGVGAAGEVLRWRLKLRRGTTHTLRVAIVVGDADDAAGAADGALAARAAQLARAFDAEAAAWAAQREARWRDAFTPGNGRYSGHLPLLVTDDEPTRRTYYHGVAAWSKWPSCPGAYRVTTVSSDCVRRLEAAPRTREERPVSSDHRRKRWLLSHTPPKWTVSLRLTIQALSRSSTTNASATFTSRRRVRCVSARRQSGSPCRRAPQPPWQPTAAGAAAAAAAAARRRGAGCVGCRRRRGRGTAAGDAPAAGGGCGSRAPARTRRRTPSSGTR